MSTPNMLARGIFSMMSLRLPMLWIVLIWVRKSSIEKLPESIFSASLAAVSSSTTSWKSFIRPTRSPIPRIRLARPSGRNSSSLSSCSPMPRNLIGLPVTALTESAAPPRASPSSLVRITPVTSSRSSKVFAVVTASWPIIASITRKMFDGCTRVLMSSSSCINTWSIVRRPAVS